MYTDLLKLRIQHEKNNQRVQGQVSVRLILDLRMGKNQFHKVVEKWKWSALNCCSFLPGKLLVNLTAISDQVFSDKKDKIFQTRCY